jgi:hypothetical protein
VDENNGHATKHSFRCCAMKVSWGYSYLTVSAASTRFHPEHLSRVVHLFIIASLQSLCVRISTSHTHAILRTCPQWLLKSSSQVGCKLLVRNLGPSFYHSLEKTSMIDVMPECRGPQAAACGRSTTTVLGTSLQLAHEDTLSPPASQG